MKRSPLQSLAAVCLAFVGLTAHPTLAAEPATGSITPSGPTITYSGTAIGTGTVVEDLFILSVEPGDYTGKLVQVRVSWISPSQDYDLSIFKRNQDGSNGAQVGSSGSGIPLTEEIASINPSAVGTGLFNIVITYFANTPVVDQPTGTISIEDFTTALAATYIKGGITFAPNSTVKAPAAAQDGEPSSRVDVFGNYYIGGIRGVPAGVDLWYFDLRPTLPDPNNPSAVVTNPNYDPFMRVPIYRGMPDSATSSSPLNIAAGGLGGGDIDLAVGFGNFTGTGASATNPQPFLAYSSLLAASVTYGRSLDRGETFQFNAAGNTEGGVPVNDRQWMEAIGNNTVYLEYRKFENSFVFVQQSIDGGLNYGPAVQVGNLQQTGAIDVDKFDGTVYISSSDGKVAVGKPATLPVPGLPPPVPTSYTTYQAIDPAINANNLFFPVKVAEGNRDSNGNLTSPGVVYGVFSDGTDIYLVHSSDQGQTWSVPVAVNDPNDPATKVNLFPWLETGAAKDSVGICWYATDHTDNTDQARWRVYYAQTFNASSDQPTFRIVQASDHSIHASNISLGGLGGAANRNLIDYFQIAFDPTGAAVIGYTDDHNDFQGHTYVARQVSGPSINGGNLPAQQEGSAVPAQPFVTPGTVAAGDQLPPQPMQPGPNGEQVTDFAQDQETGLVGVAPSNSPADIISIKYQWQDSNTGPVITATMKVSDLTTVPPNSTWRMYFTANAPETGIVGPVGNRYSSGLSDDGNQFYVQLATNANGARTATWGTVVRNSNGSLTRTQRGNADRGFINQASQTISVRVSASKLNTAPGMSQPIAFGSVLCGLRGDALSANANAVSDDTRGGTELVLGNPF